ncbi:MAG: HAD-IIIC family phosphatase [Candidatus Aminicenantes bacterium]|nr:HAD-IIIC family phosphatase [Candidatus Aminicenantes bacterium]
MKRGKEIKAVVWDLDGTIWDGILLENDDVRLKPGIRKIVETLDSRGILHSVASRNDFDTAMGKLKDFELADFFLFPEIGWNAKSVFLGRIRESLNIGMDTILFIDDSPFERDEVRYVYPEIWCVDAAKYKSLPRMARLNPRFVTEDSRRRRLMYTEDVIRKKDEKSFDGPRKDFLASLDIELVIAEGKESDLQRAEELTVRTNQLNTTGLTFSYDELKDFIHSPTHKLYICAMKDRYGSSGKIGLALVERSRSFWHLKLFLMSCRVLSYGVGTIVLSYIMQEAKKAGKKLRVDFKETGKNRQMYITLKFANFHEVTSNEKGIIVLEHDLSFIQKTPAYVKLITENE